MNYMMKFQNAETGKYYKDIFVCIQDVIKNGPTKITGHKHIGGDIYVNTGTKLFKSVERDGDILIITVEGKDTIHKLKVREWEGYLEPLEEL